MDQLPAWFRMAAYFIEGRLPFVPKNCFFRMKCQMERFNPLKMFLNQRNAFEGIPLFSFQPK